MDSYEADWPLATLMFSSDQLVVRHAGKSYSFPKKSIRLVRYKSFLKSGLKIEHSEERIPKLVVFFPNAWVFGSGLTKLISSLESLAYSIEPSDMG